MDQVYIPKVDYKVLVRCFTYNQSKYIEDALNGFAMQQTDFPFVCLVMDDCSTDGEQNVIRAWMERECDMGKAENLEIEKSFVTLIPHKSNLNCLFAFYFLKQNLYGTGDKKMCMVTPWRERCEYEALCEGDDYWVDERKLQMQAEFLDGHEDCGIVGGEKKYYEQSKRKITIRKPAPANISFNSTLLSGYFSCATCTIMYRQSAVIGYNDLVSPYRDKWKMGDLPLWLYIQSHYNAYKFDDFFSVYRILEESASHSKSYEKSIDFARSKLEILLFFSGLYAPELSNKVTQNMNREFVEIALRHRQMSQAILFLKGCKFDMKLYVKFFLSLLGIKK